MSVTSSICLSSSLNGEAPLSNTSGFPRSLVATQVKFPVGDVALPAEAGAGMGRGAE